MHFEFLSHKILLAWPGFEPATNRSEIDCANHYTIEASNKKEQIFHVESYNVLLFWRVKIQNSCRGFADHKS